MKKNAIFTLITLAVIVMLYACNAKPADNTNPEQQNTEQKDSSASAKVNITPENMVALVNADWDAVPNELLNSMGIKPLKSFKEEAKEAQNDNLQYYFGNGATVELDKEGEPIKIAAENDNAIVIYLTAESVAYGTIAFANEADYNEFMKKADANKKDKEKANEELEIEFEGRGKNTEGDDQGYEKDKWFFIDYTSNK